MLRVQRKMVTGVCPFWACPAPAARLGDVGLSDFEMHGEIGRQVKPQLCRSLFATGNFVSDSICRFEKCGIRNNDG
ncbi:MAG: hypothetical protein U5N55_00540 [Cypionkella sp.]|nr:hypothetical protein [Cypionkella sp.]